MNRSVRHRWTARWIVSATLGLLLMSGPLLAADVPGKSSTPGAERLPALDALFQRTSGWTGGDGVYSVALDEKRLLWLFGDSWVGRVHQGRRDKAVMVNNAIGLQIGRPFARRRPAFHWGHDRNDKPVAFFLPPDRRGWFWPLHGARTGASLWLFLLQIEKTDDTSPFGFKSTGLWLAQIANPNAEPAEWRVIYRKVPWSLFTVSRSLFFGSACLRDGGYLYLYGIDEASNQPGAPKELVVARVPEGFVGRFDEWRFWADGRWHRDFRLASPLLPGLATEFSVSRRAEEPPFALIFSEEKLSRRILLARAPRPEGPWGAPAPVHAIGEAAQNRNAFCYAAKAHPDLASSPGELIVSFVVNSFDLFDLLRDASLYWPRFVRIPAR